MTHKPTIFPPGEYYVGDLRHPFLDRPKNVLYWEHPTIFVGLFEDENGNEYSVDSQKIGCVSVDDLVKVAETQPHCVYETIDELKKSALKNKGGHFFKFPKEFYCYFMNDVFNFSSVRIHHMSCRDDFSYKS